MKHKDSIFEALLNERLKEVELLLSKEFEVEANCIEIIEDKEECLRKLMVSIIPKVKIIEPPKEKRNSLFALLNNLYFEAFSCDTRFFDAFNLSYETVLLWNEDYDSNDIQKFFSNYKSLLTHHINLINS